MPTSNQGKSQNHRHHRSPTCPAFMAVINTRMAARAVKLLVESQTDPVNSRARTYARETIGHTTSLSTAINVLVHEKLVNISRPCRSNEFIFNELGSSIGRFAQAAALLNSRIPSRAVESDASRLAPHIEWSNRIQDVISFCPNLYPRYQPPLPIRGNYTNSAIMLSDGQQTKHLMLINNYNSCIRGELQNMLEENVLNHCAIGSEIVCLGDKLLEANRGNWHEQVFVVALERKDMPFDGYRESNPHEILDLFIYKYVKGDVPQFPDSMRNCPRNLPVQRIYFDFPVEE